MYIRQGYGTLSPWDLCHSKSKIQNPKSLFYANGVMSRSPGVAVARRLPWDLCHSKSKIQNPKSLFYANGVMSRSPRVAVARRLPWDYCANDIEPQRGSVPSVDLTFTASLDG